MFRDKKLELSKKLTKKDSLNEMLESMQLAQLTLLFCTGRLRMSQEDVIALQAHLREKSPEYKDNEALNKIHETAAECKGKPLFSSLHKAITEDCPKTAKYLLENAKKLGLLPMTGKETNTILSLAVKKEMGEIISILPVTDEERNAAIFWASLNASVEQFQHTTVEVYSKEDGRLIETIEDVPGGCLPSAATPLRTYSLVAAPATLANAGKGTAMNDAPRLTKSPSNIWGDITMAEARRYYIIGNPIQVMEKPWLSPFATDPKEVKNSDILNSLKPRDDKKPFTIFTDLETAKTCAAIMTSNDNLTVSATPIYCRPVIQISLASEQEEQLSPVNLDIHNGMGVRLIAGAFETDSSNIQNVYSYCYRRGGSSIAVTLDEAFDLQKISREKRAATISSQCVVQ